MPICQTQRRAQTDATCRSTLRWRHAFPAPSKTAWSAGLSTGTGSLKITITPSPASAFERSAVFDDGFANGRMVVAQQGHHASPASALSVNPVNPRRSPESRGYLSPMAFELLLGTGGNNKVSHLRRQEAPQPTHALDFVYLVRDALSELLV